VNQPFVSEPILHLRPIPRFYPAPPVELKPISKWMWIASVAGVLLFGTVLIFGLRAWRSETHLGSVAVDALHANMTQGDDAAIFAQSDPAYQHDVGLEKSNRLFDLVHNRLGIPRTSFRINTNVKATTKFGETLTLVNQTMFDNGSGTETIILHKVKNTYKLLGYYVRSPQMDANVIPKDLKLPSKSPNIH
jgi:hypothetical protein